MTEVEKYCSILGISSSASVDEIKKAFRQKAKQFHPDINNSPEAATTFRDIHEAYEMLVFLKTGKGYNAAKAQYQYSKNTNTAHAARERAETFSKQSYTAYKNSDYYKKSKLIKEVRVVYELLFYVVVVLLIPGILMLFNLKWGFYFCVGLFFITMPHWVQLIPQIAKLNWERIKEGNKHVYFPAFSIHWILVPSTVIIYFTIGFQTFIILSELLVIILVFWVVFMLFLKYKKKNSNVKSIFMSLYFSVVVLNGLLLLNYIISFNATDELYQYQTSSYTDRGGKKKGSWIYLIDKKGTFVYEYYLSVRFFWDYESISLTNDEIFYKTKTGLLGYKVYTEREFRNSVMETQH